MVLRKGEVLYSGLVGGMTQNEGFFELQSDDLAQLKVVLSKHPAIKKCTEENGKILAYLKLPLEAKDLNRSLFEENIVLHHLIKRQHSLEEQFLEITNKS